MVTLNCLVRPIESAVEESAFSGKERQKKGQGLDLNGRCCSSGQAFNGPIRPCSQKELTSEGIEMRT